MGLTCARNALRLSAALNFLSIASSFEGDSLLLFLGDAEGASPLNSIPSACNSVNHFSVWYFVLRYLCVVVAQHHSVTAKSQLLIIHPSIYIYPFLIRILTVSQNEMHGEDIAEGSSITTSYRLYSSGWAGVRTVLFLLGAAPLTPTAPTLAPATHFC
jgi:hypothetical protein